MELVYLWVLKHKNIKSKGFNFSARFNCEYDEETKVITISDNKDFIKKFFGENINITALIGQNGAGKSAVIRQALSWIGGCFHIYYENEVLYFPESFKDLTINVNSSVFIKEIEYYGYSPKVNRFLYSFDILNYKKRTGSFVRFYQGEPEKDSNILAEYLGHNKGESELRLDPYSLYIKVVLLTIDSIINNSELPYFSFIAKNIKLTFFKSEINDDISGLQEINLDICREFLSLQDSETKSYENTIEHFINQGAYNSDIFLELYTLGYFVVDILDAQGVKFDELSYGERTIYVANLIIYSKIIDKGLDKPFVIFLDEPDLTLHPEWQKNYIYELHRSFNDFCEKNNLKIHFIITSHSPFIVSDMPNQNVVFLDRNKKTGECIVVDSLEKKDTFGANIHTLLSDSFFMDSLIGKFAKNKIEEVINFLHNKDSKVINFSQAEEVISIIGEPILKMKLEKMLDKYKLDSGVETKEDIQREINRLNRRLDSINNDKN